MRVFVVVLFLICCQSVFAQQRQQVAGRVEDFITRSGLVGASVILLQDTVQTGTTSDASGAFVFNNIFPGRYILKVSYTGYESTQDEILVISARRTEVSVQLREFQNTLDEVEIVSSRAQSYEPGEHSITNEKALRLPANFFDPVRAVTSYPGVMTANDQNNTIVIRGNSPAGLLWKINGLDVVNPNHLSNAGTFSDKPVTFGGGVNIISSQLMERTDFYTGAQPVRYGNALSGVIDMKLRGGDTTDYKYTAQASLIGIDLAAEGPIGKKKNTSFLVNYRYSTVGLLSMMGVKFGDEDISFQDLTFTLNSSFSKGRSLSWFGFIGSSKNSFSKDEADREVQKDLFKIDYDSKNFGAGVTFNQAKQNTNFSTGVSVSGSDQTRDQFAHEPVDGQMNEDQLAMDKLLVSAFGRVNVKSGVHLIEAGVQINYIKDNLLVAGQYDLDYNYSYAYQMQGALLQPFVQWKVLFSDKWNAHVAARSLYYSYNETFSVEPRAGIEFTPTSNSSFKVSYNVVSQIQTLATYSDSKFNENLGLTKAHHFDLSYTHVSNSNLRFSVTPYYQHLFDVPVEDHGSPFSQLNVIETFVHPTLVSQGTGRNYGVEVLTEKSFFDKSYFIAGGTLYKSQYKGADGVERNTRFDGNYSVNVTYGREWTKMKKSSQRSFGVSSRALYLGGLREEPYIDDMGIFEDKLKDYFRLDLRLNWRKNKGRYTRTIAVDIQNLLGTKNEAYHYYDNVKEKVVTQYQLGLIPVLVYRIDF